MQVKSFGTIFLKKSKLEKSINDYWHRVIVDPIIIQYSKFKVDYWPRLIRGEIGGGRKSEMNGGCMESSPQPHNQVTSSMEKYEYCERKREQDYEYKDAKNMKLTPKIHIYSFIIYI